MEKKKPGRVQPGKKPAGKPSSVTHVPDRKKVSSGPVRKYPFPLMAGGVLLVTFLVYFNSLFNEFTNWDDQSVKTFAQGSIGAAFSGSGKEMYSPLTTVSYILDFQVSGVDPFMYHLSNLVVHLLNVLLVIVLLRKLTGKDTLALLGGLFFGIHPVNAQAVDWISARSTLLFTLFALGSLIAYMKYLGAKQRWAWYGASLLLFLMSLLSKSQVLTLPLLLFLFDWKQQRPFTKATLIDKLPFFALSLVFGLIALNIRELDMGLTPLKYSGADKLLIAVYTVVNFCYKLLVPVHLSAIHPFPARTGGAFPAVFYLAPLVLLVLCVLVYMQRKRRPGLLFGFGFFLLTLAMVLPVFSFTSGMVAERYAYLPCVGFFIMLASLPGSAATRSVKRSAGPLVKGVLAVYGLFFAVTTVQANATWKDSLSLWNNVISKHPDVSVAYINRGNILTKMKDFDGAIRDYDKAIATGLFTAEAYLSRGNALKRAKNYSGAIADFNQVLVLAPGNVTAVYNRGLVKKDMKDFRGAYEDFDKAVGLGYEAAWYERGISRMMLEDFNGAIADFTKSIALNQDVPICYFNRANSKMRLNDLRGALQDLTDAIRVKPDYQKAYVNRALLRNSLKDYAGAVEDFTWVINRDPRAWEACYYRAEARMQLKDYQGAAADFRRVLSLKPGFGKAQAGLALVQQASGRK